MTRNKGQPTKLGGRKTSMTRKKGTENVHIIKRHDD